MNLKKKKLNIYIEKNNTKSLTKKLTDEILSRHDFLTKSL